jgi:hypothetical protein
MWTGLVWLRIGTGGELLWIRYWTFGIHKMLGNYRVSKQLGISEVVLSCMDLVKILLLVTILSQMNLVHTCTSYVFMLHLVSLFIFILDGRVFDYWCYWIFTIYIILLTVQRFGVDSASNRNEYQKMFLGSRVQPARKFDNLTNIFEPIV